MPRGSSSWWSATASSHGVDLSATRLLLLGWDTFIRRPWLVMGMWIVYALLTETNPLTRVVLPLLVVAGPIRGGYDMAMLRLIRGDDSVAFDDVFAGFSKFSRLLFTWLLYSAAVIAGAVLFIVPGIVLALAIWPAFLLVMEDDLSPLDAIMGAWALTLGHKMDLFVLLLASAVILVAGVLAFGVGVLIAGPIVGLAWVHAYHEMRTASSNA